jgi:hypothetical protein
LEPFSYRQGIGSQTLAPQGCAEPDANVTLKGIQMNTPHKMAIALVLAATAGVSSAQGLTRAQVEADLQTAIRNGDMMAPGDSGLTERQLNPGAYPPAPVVAGKSRAQVEAELAAAQRHGDLVQASGLRDRDIEPGMYPPDPVVAGKTRAQVKEELAMAIRDGDMVANGELGQTDDQLEPAKYAAQRAIDAQTRLAQQGAVSTGAVAAQ